MKEVEDYINRWKDIPCSWTGRLNIVKMTILPKTWYIPKAIYRFNAISIKISMAFFIELEQIILKIYGNTKIPNSQNNFEKEKQSWRYHTP